MSAARWSQDEGIEPIGLGAEDLGILFRTELAGREPGLVEQQREFVRWGRHSSAR